LFFLRNEGYFDLKIAYEQRITKWDLHGRRVVKKSKQFDDKKAKHITILNKTMARRNSVLECSNAWNLIKRL
jgi:hypothetical protein